MKKRPTDAFDNVEKPVEITDALNQSAAQSAWSKLREQNKPSDQTIIGAHNRYYCVKNLEDIGSTHYTIEIFPPGSDRGRLDVRVMFILVKTKQGKFKVLPSATIFENEEFEISARDANNMLAEIAAGTREVKENPVVDGIQRRTRKKVAKIK